MIPLKYQDCDSKMIEFAKTMTLDYIHNYNDTNKILCYLAKNLRSEFNPKIYFIHKNTIYSFEFLCGQEEVILGELSFVCQNSHSDTYIFHLISDPHRVWKYTSLLYDGKDEHLSNQVLTLLRICKVDKEDYKKNSEILSNKFK